MAKAEWTAEDGGASVGLVGGGGDSTRPFFGETASALISDFLTIYVDAAHRPGSDVFYPVFLEDAQVDVYRRTRESDPRLFSRVLAGAKVATGGGSELRAEYYFNGEGYSRNDFTRSLALARELAGRGLGASAALYFAPGTDFLGHHYTYLSARIPDLGPGKSITLFARALRSLQDASLVGFAAVEWQATDQSTFFASAAYTPSPPDRELHQAVTGLANLGVKRSW